MDRTKNNSIWNLGNRLEGDVVVWVIVIILLLFSVLCMFSSTSRLLKGDVTRVDLVKEQLGFVLGGFLLIFCIYKFFKIKALRILSSLGFFLSFILLLILDCHIRGSVIKAIEINKAWRILQVAGFQIHVMEVVKVAMTLYLAWAIDALKKGDLMWKCLPTKIKTISIASKKIIYIYLPFLIILGMALPAGNSGALFIGAIMYIVILLGGGSAKDMFLLAVAGIAALLLCFGIYKISDGQKMQRIGTAMGRLFDKTDYEEIFLNSGRGTKQYQEALDEIRQPVSAKIAIKEGGFIGKGPGQSTQRYVVPSISEDYMYSFIIEEYGVIGGLLVIILYVSLLARGSIIVKNCGDELYAKLSVAGLCLLITLQAFLHMFVNADIGPMTGQTLPLISHGASAFLCFCIAFGVILSISRLSTPSIKKETAEEVALRQQDSTRASLDDLDSFESEL